MKITYVGRSEPDLTCRFDLGEEVLRMTIPAREALLRAGATVSPAEDRYDGIQRYLVRLDPSRELPQGLVAFDIIGTDDCGLRLDCEPPYPNEYANYWRTLQYTGCPVCGHPLAWWEAGYVPGYRLCTGPCHHHVLATW